MSTNDDRGQEDTADLKDIDKILKKLVESLEQLNENVIKMGKNTKKANEEENDRARIRQQEKRLTNEAYFEQLKDMALFRKSLKESGNQFNFLTGLLTRGASAVTVMGEFTKKLANMGDRFDELAQATKDVSDFEEKIKSRMKEENRTGEAKDNADLLGDKDRAKYGQAQKNKKDLEAGGAGGMGNKYMSKMMQFADKHKTGLVLGAGVATILLKVLKMAFDASPMFQQVRKLLQFGVMMVLRPIGDFFGFLFRPIMIMLLRKFIIPWYTKMYPVMMQMGDIIGRKLAGAFEALAEGDIVKAFGILFADVTWENVFKESFKGLKQWYDDGLTGITTAWDDFWDATILWFETGIGTVLGTWSEIWDGLIGWVTDGMTILATSSSWSDFWDKIIEWFQKGIDGYVIQFGDIWEKIVDWLRDILPFGLGNALFPEAAENVVPAAVEHGGDILKDVSDGIGDFMKDPLGTLWDMGQSLFEPKNADAAQTTNNKYMFEFNTPTGGSDEELEQLFKRAMAQDEQERSTKFQNGV